MLVFKDLVAALLNLATAIAVLVLVLSGEHVGFGERQVDYPLEPVALEPVGSG